MNILVVAATAFEIKPVVDNLKARGFESGKNFCDVLITGVGAVATTYHLTKYLAANKAEVIIQAGIAGSFRHEISIGSVFYVEEERFGDIGAEEAGEFRDLFDLGLINGSDLPFSEKTLKNPFSDLLQSLDLPPAKSIGINEITTRKERIEVVLKKYNPDIESMEGAAFHYICLLEKIPFIQLRAVSNYVGERDKSKWDIKLAIDNLSEKLLQILESK